MNASTQCQTIGINAAIPLWIILFSLIQRIIILLMKINYLDYEDLLMNFLPRTHKLDLGNQGIHQGNLGHMGSLKISLIILHDSDPYKPL